MPDPVPAILCAASHIAAMMVLIVRPRTLRVMRRVAIGLMVGVCCITLMKFGYAAAAGPHGPDILIGVLLFVGPSFLPSLPLLGMPGVAQWLGDRRVAAWGFIGAALGGGVVMTGVMMVDLRADALNGVVLLFGPVVALLAAALGGLIAVTMYVKFAWRRERVGKA